VEYSHHYYAGRFDQEMNRVRKVEQNSPSGLASNLAELPGILCDPGEHSFNLGRQLYS